MFNSINRNKEKNKKIIKRFYSQIGNNTTRNLIENLISNFELEFCLTKKAFIKAYNNENYEAGYAENLWNENHETQMANFHELYKTEDGQQRIIEDIKAINLVFFKRRKSFLNGFNKADFSDAEYDFLTYFIMESKI